MNYFQSIGFAVLVAAAFAFGPPFTMAHADKDVLPPGAAHIQVTRVLGAAPDIYRDGDVKSYSFSERWIDTDTGVICYAIGNSSTATSISCLQDPRFKRAQ